jgi:hypothetical protein
MKKQTAGLFLATSLAVAPAVLTAGCAVTRVKLPLQHPAWCRYTTISCFLHAGKTT